MTEKKLVKIKFEWELGTEILEKLKSFSLLAADSSFFGPKHNRSMFMLRLYYQSLSLELGNFPNPVKIKSFAAKIYGEHYTLFDADDSDPNVFHGSVRQIFPGSL